MAAAAANVTDGLLGLQADCAITGRDGFTEGSSHYSPSHRVWGILHHGDAVDLAFSEGIFRKSRLIGLVTGRSHRISKEFLI